MYEKKLNMKITFILSSANINGGTKVIAMYAKYLSLRGHQVVVLCAGPRHLSWKKRIKKYVFNSKSEQSYFSLEYFNCMSVPIKIMDRYREIVDDDIPDGDVVISTFWLTADWVRNLSKSKGVKVGLYQGFEISPECSNERNEGIIKSWEMPFVKIVVSSWLKSIAKDRFGDNEVRLVSNGVACEDLLRERRSQNKKKVVGFLFSDNWFKAPEMYVDLVEHFQKINKDIDFIAFGSCCGDKLPSSVNYIRKPKQNEIGDIYAACDVWVCASRQEGFGLPILEAMARRTPVVSTRIGAAEDLITDGVNGYVVSVDDLDAIIKVVLKLLCMNPDEWCSYSEQAYNTAVMHTVDLATTEFEAVLYSIVGNN